MFLAEVCDVIVVSLCVCDWVNIFIEDMGLQQLEDVVCELVSVYGVQIEVIIGDVLLEQNFLFIYVVGCVLYCVLCLIVLCWGNVGQLYVVLVGKGVCFDIGGLDIKLVDGMCNMKKDMGGVVYVLGLVGLIMVQVLLVQLILLILVVENVIGLDVFCFGEVIVICKGLSIEIDNIDVEGWVILVDVLIYVSEQQLEIVFDFVIFIGVVCIVLGLDLLVFFSNDDILVQ